MNIIRERHSRRAAFTIVELLVVILVIVILAGIVGFSVRTWRQRTAQNEVQNDLRAASTAMENEKNFSNGYPLALPASFTASTNVTVTLKTSTTTNYCIEGTSKAVAGVLYSASNSTPTPKPHVE